MLFSSPHAAQLTPVQIEPWTLWDYWKDQDCGITQGLERIFSHMYGESPANQYGILLCWE